MESFIPIFRMAHFVGLSMLLGGTLCSMALVHQEKPSATTVKSAWNCIHLIASPGLLLLIITGILQSAAVYWEHFKGAGYMHAKIAIVFAIFLFVIADMKTQKKALKNSQDQDLLLYSLKKRQIYAASNCVLVMVIMWLVSYRPF